VGTITAEERRRQILAALHERGSPVTGAALARETGVSRQVIVQDVAVLRAAGHGIIATPQGYIVLPAASGAARGRPARRAVLACRHTREQAAAELNTLVDHGLKVLDVVVEHPLYGEMTGRLMLETRDDVRAFTERLESGQVQLLSALTGGVHLHTVEAPTTAALEAARAALARQGLLVVDDTEAPPPTDAGSPHG
jgi:transcriptional regulator of NAD metabolism